MRYRRKTLSDGTYLISDYEDKNYKYHWHVAPDGTILTVKEGGNYLYKRSDVRKNIKEVTGMDINIGWTPEK